MPRDEAAIFLGLIVASVLVAALAVFSEYHVYILTRFGYSPDFGLLPAVFLVGSILLWKQKRSGLLFFFFPALIASVTAAFMIHDARTPIGNLVLCPLLFAVSADGWRLREYLSN